MGEPVATGQGSRPEAAPLPFERLRRLVPVMVVCLFPMILFFGFLIESLRGDQDTLSFRIADLPISDTEIAHNHGRLVRDCTALVLLGVAVGVLWLVWQYRSHANLRALVPSARIHPVVAVALWLIPGVNLIAPPFVLMELIWLGEPREERVRNALASLLVVVWWSTVLAGVILAGWALAPVVHDPVTLSRLLRRDHRAVVAAGVGIITVLATGAVILILDSIVAQREDRLWAGEWRGWAERRR